MGCKVIAIDLNDDALQGCKNQGADITLNSKSRADDWIGEVKARTKGGVHAAAVFSAATAAYQSAPSLIRPGGVLMVVGIASEPLHVSTFDLAIGRYRIKSDSTGIPQRMKKAIDFTVKHGIVPELEVRPGLEDVDAMIKDMKAGRSSKRMAVVFE